MPVQPVDPWWCRRRCWGWRAKFGGVGTRCVAGAVRRSAAGAFVTPLGDSLPTPPTGRWRRSLRPGRRPPDPPGAARRGVRRDPRARAVGARSVAHDRHAPCRTDGWHVPRRGALDQLPPAGATAATAARPDRRARRRVEGRTRARAAPPRGRGDDFTVLFNGVETAAIRPPRRCRRHDRRSSSSAGTKSARAGRAAPGISHARPRRVVLGGGRRARHRPPADRSRRRHQDRVAGPRRRGGEARPLARRLGRLRPSLHGESFGVVLIEAMAAGTPVVASSLDGYRNVATDGVDALLVEPGNRGRWPRSSACSASRPGGGTGGQGQRSRRRFSMSRLADEYVAIYSRLSSWAMP